MCRTATNASLETLTSPRNGRSSATISTMTSANEAAVVAVIGNTALLLGADYVLLAKLHGVVVAPYWSNIAGRCVIPGPLSFATSENRLPGFAASPSRPVLAFRQMVSSPVLGRPASAETARRSADPGKAGWPGDALTR